MFLGSLFKKYKLRTNRILLIHELIQALEFDEKQKQLYIDSVDILDAEGLDIFYKKLAAMIDIYEEKTFSQNTNENKKKINDIRSNEEKQRNRETSSLNLLFDNI